MAIKSIRLPWPAWRANPRRLEYLPDCVVLGAICLLFIAHCALCGRGLMWVDELLSFNLIHDPSISHMLGALGDQADGAPPVYYLSARLWALAFSDDPTSLRMFSTFGFCVGFTLLWVTIRPAFGFFPSAVAVTVTIGLNEIIVFQSSSARFYGLLFALISLAVLLAFKFSEDERPSPPMLAANVLTQGMLVLCHPLGGFYGAAIMVAVGVSDFLCKPSRVRPRVLASYCAGWLVILLWWHQFFRQAAIPRPQSCTPVPSLANLRDHLLQQSSIFPLLIFLSLCWLSSMLRARVGRASPMSGFFALAPHQRALLLIALSLIGIAPFFWVMSHLVRSNPVFSPRYLIGTTVGWTVLLAQLVAFVMQRYSHRSQLLFRGVALLFMLAALLPLCGASATSFSGNSAPDPKAFSAGSSDRRFGHFELPIVCPEAQEFLARTHYSSDASRYFYLLNWDVTAELENFPDAAVQNHIMSALNRHYSVFANVINASDFLRDHPAFLVLDVPKCRWQFLTLGSNACKITRLTVDPPVRYDHDGEYPLLLVKRQR